MKSPVDSIGPAMTREDALDWKGEDWEAARQRGLLLGLAASPAERLAWLEEMIALAWSSGALPKRRL